MSPGVSVLDEEIETWKGFPYVLRKDDREAWDSMIKEVKERFGGAVERSGRTFATDPFFMALLLLQRRMIRQLRAQLEAAGVDVPGPTANSTLDRLESETDS